MCSDVSPTDAEAENAFSREAVGRQSMSEKRKAYMDARLLNFYQHAKSAKGKVRCYDLYVARDDDVDIMLSVNCRHIAVVTQLFMRSPFYK